MLYLRSGLDFRNLVALTAGLTLFSMLRPGGGFLSGPPQCPLAGKPAPPTPYIRAKEHQSPARRPPHSPQSWRAAALHIEA